MAPARGKKRMDPQQPAKSPEIDGTGLSPIPELMRRAIALGLTGFFSTEEAVRRAVGDTLPKDWVDFLSESSDRTRSEFLERLSHEIGRVLEGVDLAEVLSGLLEGRTLQVNAEFRLTDDGSGRRAKVRLSDARARGDEE
jgi:hypothetical protein